MQIKKEANKIIVVHDIGEEIMSSLAQLAKDDLFRLLANITLSP